MSEGNGATERKPQGGRIPSTGRPNPSAQGTRRARRAPGHIQELILRSARESFAAKGYARSTTRDIAERAEVAETLLFRNYGSKANLFGEAVLLPLADFLTHWVERAADTSNDLDNEALQEEFVDALYRTARANKGLLLTFFATSFFEPEVLEVHEAGPRAQRALNDLADAVSERVARLGIDTTDMNVSIGARASIGMVLSVALFDGWLLPSGRARPKRSEIIHELSRQIMYGGFNLRPSKPGRKSVPEARNSTARRR